MSAAWNAHPAAAGATGAAAAAADPVAYEYATPPTHQNPGMPMPPVRQVPHGAGAREHLIELLLDGGENTDVPAEAMDVDADARARANGDIAFAPRSLDFGEARGAGPGASDGEPRGSAPGATQQEIDNEILRLEAYARSVRASGLPLPIAPEEQQRQIGVAYAPGSPL